MLCVGGLVSIVVVASSTSGLHLGAELLEVLAFSVRLEVRTGHGVKQVGCCERGVQLLRTFSQHGVNARSPRPLARHVGCGDTHITYGHSVVEDAAE